MYFMKRIFWCLSLMCSCLWAGAQSLSLPYRNEFKTSADRSAFSIVRKGATTSYSWRTGTSGDAYASHDYPVGNTDKDTTSDWMVSPALKIPVGSVLSFKYFVFGITGMAQPIDRFAVWFGKGSADPANGTYVKVCDLTQTISNQYQWKDTFGIQIPSGSDTGYIAFEYQATNNWFVVGFDSIVLKDPGTGIKPFLTCVHQETSVYPNPSTERLFISTMFAYTDFSIVDAQGRATNVVYNEEEGIDISVLPQGIYSLVLRNSDISESVKFTKF